MVMLHLYSVEWYKTIKSDIGPGLIELKGTVGGGMAFECKPFLNLFDQQSVFDYIN